MRNFSEQLLHRNAVNGCFWNLLNLQNEYVKKSVCHLSLMSHDFWRQILPLLFLALVVLFRQLIPDFLFQHFWGKENTEAYSEPFETSKTELSAKIVKGALSGLRQFLVTESPLRLMKNAFYFLTLKALFVLKIFKFLFWFVGHI